MSTSAWGRRCPVGRTRPPRCSRAFYIMASRRSSTSAPRTPVPIQFERLGRGAPAGTLDAPYIYGTGGHLTLPGTHPVYTIFSRRIQQEADAILAATPPGEPANLYSLGLGISLVRANEAARTAVRERADGGMDAIKITIETGPASFGDNHPLMPVDMVRAIVDEATRHSLPVFAHVTSPNELDAALQGGTAGVVHAVMEPPFPDRALARQMLARKFVYVPTLTLVEGWVRYTSRPEGSRRSVPAGNGLRRGNHGPPRPSDRRDHSDAERDGGGRAWRGRQAPRCRDPV